MKTNIFREIAEEGIKEGIEKGIKEGIKQTAKRMKNQNFTTEDIIKATGLTKKEIQKL